MADNTSSDDCIKTWSHDKMNTFKIEHIWKIDHFSDKIFQTKDKFSPKFFHKNHDIKFNLKLVLANDAEKVKNIGLFLFCYHGEAVKSDVPTTFELAFLKNDDSVDSRNDIKYTFSNVKKYGHGRSSFEKYSTIMDPKNNYLHGGHQLVIRCKVAVSYNEVQIQSLPVEDSISSESKFKSNQKSLLDSGEMSDFSIVVGRTKIPVHKCILSAHSPVFKAMFGHCSIKEAREKKVIIPDVSVDAMKDFLQFIYTGGKPQNDSSFLELLILAEKYQVDYLKFHCENYLSSALTIDNVVNVYLVADLHNASNLRDNCLAFMASNFNNVLLSQGWQQMCKTDGEKTAKVCCAVSSILCPKRKLSEVDPEESAN